MSYVVWPYMKIENEWTIPDKMIMAIWDKIVELNRVKPTWYDGSVKNKEEFIEFMRDPYIFSILVVDADKIRLCALAWLNDIIDGTARAHFCFLDKYHPEVIQAIINYWKKIDSLEVITGITPKTYKHIIKIADRAGFKIVGTIPQICNMYYENRREGGVVCYYLTKGESNGRE